MRQADGALFASAVRARVTLARMSLALAVQMNGLGSRLCSTMQLARAGDRRSTLANAPVRRRWVVMSRKNRSTMFSHDELVGVKYMRNRGCAANHFFTLECLCVAELSAIT